MKTRLFLILIVFSITIGNAQTSENVNLQELDAYFARMVEDWEIPSASIGIVKDGELVFTGNYGVLEVGRNQKPDENTLYAIASNSKAFTSAIIGMLVQEGKLNWNDPVRKYLPYFELYGGWESEHASIRDILSHRVGLGTFSGDNIWYKSELSAPEIIRHIKYVPRAYEFRSGYGYSNLMFITAGAIIEKVTGKSWGENVKERILEPLGMERTLYSVAQLEDNGIIGTDSLLSKHTRNMVWTPHNNHMVDHTSENDFDRHFNAYGLGWGLSDYHGRLKVGHTGGYDGMITAVTLIPDEKLGVVVLTNGPKSPIMAATYYALDTFLGIKNDKDWSADYLAAADKRMAQDTRIADRIANRVKGTQPSISPDSFVGKYHSDLYGELQIVRKGADLKLEFSHSPLLSATLTHWHYNVWKINWDHPQAWFSFGTIQIEANNMMEVTGFAFDVPNDDFFFEEIKPKKVKK